MYPATSTETVQAVLAEYETAADGYLLAMLGLIDDDLAEAIETRDAETAHVLADVAMAARERFL